MTSTSGRRRTLKKVKNDESDDKISSSSMQSMIQKVNNSENEDILSSLPVELLIHILSFLPTLYAIRTSVLSSQWKNLWTFVHILDFDKDLLLSQMADGVKLIKLVDSVLALNKSPYIKMFRVKGRSSIDAFHVHKWITHAIRHNVEEIDIDVVTKQSFILPQELLASKSLVSLRIENLHGVDFPSSVYLPQLRVLHLSLHCSIYEIAEKVFRNCPVLEDLQIDSPTENGEDTLFDLSTSSLKVLNLNLHSDDYFTDEFVGPRNKIMLNAPVLEHLTVQDDYLGSYIFKNLYSLVTASIDVGICCMQRLGTKEHAYHLLTLLDCITNVKFLILYATTMGVLDCTDGINLPLFSNLIHLVVVVGDCYTFGRISDLLGSAPNLVTLELVRDPEHDESRSFKWVAPQTTPACFLPCLEQIEIYGFKGLRGELAVLKYVLENARALKKVKIKCVGLSLEKQLLFKSKLVELKGSEACDVDLMSDETDDESFS